MLHLSKVRMIKYSYTSSESAHAAHFCLFVLRLVFLNQGDFVWVDSSVGVPIGAEVHLTDTGQLQLIDDEGKVK